jgi:hypothetical protein
LFVVLEVPRLNEALDVVSYFTLDPGNKVSMRATKDYAAGEGTLLF